MPANVQALVAADASAGWGSDPAVDGRTMMEWGRTLYADRRRTSLGGGADS